MGQIARLTLAVLLALAATAVAADPPPAPAEPAVPAKLNDPAFDRYFDIELLGQALADHKPSALADSVLQLLEGERVLFRKHKGLNSQKLFALAARLANEADDTATVERLGKAAAALKRDDLARALTAADVGGTRRKLSDPAAGVNLDRYEVAEVVTFRTRVDQIRTAVDMGNKGQLDQLEKDIRGLRPYPQPLTTALVKFLGQARAELPASEPDEDMDPVARLATATRAAKQFTESKVQIKNSTAAAVSFSLYGSGEAKTLPPGETKTYTVRLEGYWTPRTAESEKVPYAVHNNVKTLLYGEGSRAQGRAHAGKYEFVGEAGKVVLKESSF